MIGFLRRFRRAPVVVEHDPVVHHGVVVADGTGHGVGDALCSALAVHGIAAYAIDPFEVDAGADVVVLLLPVRPDTMPMPGGTALSVLGRVGADPVAAAAFRSRLVVVWYLRNAARPRLSAPGVGRTGRVWNGSELLLATSWRRELAHHGGDLAAAVRCRSGRVDRMVHAPTHHRLGANLVPDVCRDLRVLDPDLVHGLCVEVADHRVDDTVLRWTGARSVAAAVRVSAAAAR
ncbi:hypothetical protein GCM10022243_54660 [Saccharothrix violaceirubra]|uniref:Uncharacterized protein n=1 Tax=Saccharothrix violaceirubra TaxID=413306 RepID=A0A7W7WX18_9PSEU|nr:hypothetical protein [Saccharothrix violaceirubra]MBB4966979.1 hypothetical protein [Saccharothrix violaceirubra]